jgi:hypothetical protein
MVAIGILSIAMMGMMTLQTNLQRETRALTEKLESLDLEKFIISALADGRICTAELTPSVFNGNKSFKINAGNPEETVFTLEKGLHSSVTDPTKILIASGDVPSALIKTLKVKSDGITITDFVKVDSNLYSANIKVEFDGKNLVRQIKPISVKTTVATNTSNTIIGCGIAAGGAAFGGTYDDCTCKGWGRCKGNHLNNDLYSCPSGFTPYLFSTFDDRGKCGHALVACYK